MIEFEKEFLNILRHFQKSGALEHLVLVGSWVLILYKKKYGINIPPFTTRDIDFSIKRPQDAGLISNPSIHKTLTGIGYIPQFSLISKSEKYVPAVESVENNLNIEFVCEPGRKIQEPFKIKGLAVVATPVRFQKTLLDHLEQISYKGFTINLPNPDIWAIHKIAISQSRTGTSAKLKMVKDLEGAKAVVDFFGNEKILAASTRFRGKFLTLFKKGWEKFSNKYIEYY